MDFFTDYFTAEQLLLSVRNAAYIPGQAAQFFQTESLDGTKFDFEELPAQNVSLLTESPRGVPKDMATLVRNKIHTFNTKHYRKDATVYADEVLNARAPGGFDRDRIVRKRDEKVKILRDDIDATLEGLRIACINTPTNSLGTAPASASIAFSKTDDIDVRVHVFTKIVKPLETALAGLPYSGIHVLCQDTFWEGLLASKTIKETYMNQQAANMWRDSNTTDRVYWANIMFERYRGGSSVDIASGKAKVIPLGVPNLFIQAFAPADTMDTIGAGQKGSPYFMQAYPIEGNRGMYMEMQTNPVMVCTRPTAILTLGLS
jgi:hypothetical protein